MVDFSVYGRDWLERHLDAGSRLYLQPAGLGREGQKLAGGWQGFLSVRLIVRDVQKKIETVLLSLPAIESLLSIKAVDSLYENLTAVRPAYSGLSMNKPHSMGIINVTPDSFSDGGDNFRLERAVENACKMSAQGASIIDVGGESTRPGASFVTPEEEKKRILPFIERLALEKVLISVDTRKAVVMQAAVRAGADILNDVSALEQDPESLQTVVSLARPVILMHMQKEPATMQVSPSYSHVVLDVYDYLEERIASCLRAGVKRSRIMVDVGIGFGKTLEHNLQLMSHLSLFHGLAVPLLLGASRKSFIDKITPAREPKMREAGSLAAMLSGLMQGVQIFRVHDVFEAEQALRVFCHIHEAGVKVWPDE